MRRFLVLAVVVLAACGGSDESSSTTTTEPEATTTTELAPADLYRSRVRNRGLGDYSADPSEVESVAANLCDNSVGEFRVLATDLLPTIYANDTEVAEALTEKRIMVEVFCPDTLLQFDEAMTATGFASRIG